MKNSTCFYVSTDGEDKGTWELPGCREKEKRKKFMWGRI